MLQATSFATLIDQCLSIARQFIDYGLWQFITLQILDCYEQRHQIHLAIHINRPEQSDVEYEMDRVFSNESAQHGRAEHVLDNVMLIRRCFEFSPAHFFNAWPARNRRRF